MNTNIIVIKYTPNSEKKFIRIVKGGGYEEVTDSSIATLFPKKKQAAGWIKSNMRHSEFAKVDDIKYHLKPLKGA